MSDYTKLVKALRYCGNFAEREGCAESCEYFNDMDCPNRIMSDAAAAIEELQAQLPKRGEIVRCRECRWGTMCVTGQHLGLDGFCSKGEREVQE